MNVINLEKFRRGKNQDFEVDFRGFTVKPNDGYIKIVAYMWKTESRRECDRMFNLNYCQFRVGDKVSAVTDRGIRISGKITSVDDKYYGGDCHVLFIKSDKRSLTRYLKSKAATEEKQKISA